MSAELDSAVGQLTVINPGFRNQSKFICNDFFLPFANLILG